MKLGLLAMLWLTAYGCASFAPPTESTAPRAPAPLPRPIEPAPPPAPNQASTSLLEQSRDERAAGRLPQAAAAVERALGIEPNNPLLWLELGEIRLAQGDSAQADAMGRKALTLAGGDRTIERRAAQLMGR